MKNLFGLAKLALTAALALGAVACQEEVPGGKPVGADNLPALPGGTNYDGWTWVEIPASTCRDGSPAGYYYRLGKSKELLVYLNGGGACADPFFCGLNPVNVDQDLPIELLIGGTPNLLLGPNASRQIAPNEGIFKKDDARNPVRDWNMIYVPYCSGDIHAGSRRNVQVPGVNGVQQFMGFVNYGLFLQSFGPGFQNAGTVLLTGSSAGGFGTLINFDRTQEYFKSAGAKVLAVTDSGIPFRDQYMATCLQKKWRTLWGLNDAIPAACGPKCFDPSGGKLVEGLGQYLFHEKYGDRFVGGVISTDADQIIRAFFAPGLSATAGQPDDCTLDPGGNTVASALFLGRYEGSKYHAALKDVMDNVVGWDKAATYFWNGEGHMHLWRPDYYNTNGNQHSIAEWLGSVVAGKLTHEGKL
jgi:Pectinacetylesterase